MDNWFEQNLVCPVEKTPLVYSGNHLCSKGGRKYPVIDGVPIMLIDTDHTLWVGKESFKQAREIVDQTKSHENNYFLGTLGISEEEKYDLEKLINKRKGNIDPVVSFLIGATCGNTYKHFIRKLEYYPIPDLRLPSSKGKLLLEIGCNWGRWSLAAAQKGYMVVGIDPSLGAIMAARRVATQLNLPIKYLVADARHLPFSPGKFDVVFSYSVLQHLNKKNVRKVLSEINLTLKVSGISLIQMAHALGIRSLQVQIMRGFREARDFEVRYWGHKELSRTFSRLIGPTDITVDCFFGLGLQEVDAQFMPKKFRYLIACSEYFRKLSRKLRWLNYFADSVYLESIKSTS